MLISHRLASWGLLCLGLAAAAPALGDAAAPFRTRNLNLPVAIFGLPTWERIPEDSLLGVTTEVANHYRLSRRGADQLILDGETVRWTFFYERRVGTRWSVGAELPVFRQFGGRLDNAVDAWHSVLNQPDGGRNNRPEDVLLFELAQNQQAFFYLDQSSDGLGDLKLSVARRFGTDEGYLLRAAVKLPTGDESILAGSGSADWNLTLLRARPAYLRRRTGGFFWGLGVMKLGAPERIRFTAEDTGLVALIGGGLELGPRFGVKAQIDVHTPLYDTPLEEIGQTAVQATIGGWWRLPNGKIDFGVVEDLHVSTAPDVVLHVGVEWRPRRTGNRR